MCSDISPHESQNVSSWEKSVAARFNNNISWFFPCSVEFSFKSIRKIINVTCNNCNCSSRVRLKCSFINFHSFFTRCVFVHGSEWASTSSYESSPRGKELCYCLRWIALCTVGMHSNAQISDLPMHREDEHALAHRNLLAQMWNSPKFNPVSLWNQSSAMSEISSWCYLVHHKNLSADVKLS